MIGIVPLALLSVLALIVLIFLITRFLVNVGADQIAIMERQFVGSELEPGRVFALGMQVGLRAAFLAPGLHFVCWPFIKVVSKPKFVIIGADELGIVEATDGIQLGAGRIFA
ncbi:MAG: hypothetical protein JNM63_04170, partial [Spirochaetia bacterium]|nr:hypothetical protein [Spirochaetia bacterium]